MRYEILGTLRITSGDEEFVSSTRKVEIILATLLIRADQIVPTKDLLAELWDENQPKHASASLYAYVSQLRKLLAQASERDDLIATRTSGYVLHLGSDDLDLHFFEQALKRGRSELAAGNAKEANAALKEALSVWRGSPLDGLQGGPTVNSFTQRIKELRLEALEMLIVSNFLLDRHREMISVLYSLIAGHPHHEVFYQHLMLALYRSQRQADALHVYERACAVSDSLGLRPGRSLRHLHEAILNKDKAVLSTACPASWAPRPT
ncbi:AfsR/SARP family transcriptional regulator [Streptomyces sp. NRRL F-5126]|uniref:AfsR/SARP family transcriptional regulator n=1 Tax=Streptomyces sp. NRRL F-5126 TaxID=1463857 RepID=UPI00068F79E3|nr:AfsR/SARP family transcriptional regulator [Streptomyces sp. NRRL F-5126]